MNLKIWLGQLRYEANGIRYLSNKEEKNNVQTAEAANETVILFLNKPQQQVYADMTLTFTFDVGLFLAGGHYYKIIVECVENSCITRPTAKRWKTDLTKPLNNYTLLNNREEMWLFKTI